MANTKNYFTFYIFTIILTIIFFSCSSNDSNLVVKPNMDNVLKKDIDPDAMSYEVKYVPFWRFDHYSPKTNKLLIVWPEPNADIVEYHEKWGFNGIIVNLNQSAWNNARFNGHYPASNIIATLPWYQSISYIKNQITNVYSELYYLDEPLDQYRFTKYEILEIANHITSLYPSSKLLLGSFNNPTGWYSPYVESFYHAYNYVLNGNSNTMMMCDKYYGDQRYMWGRFKTYYGSRVYGHYIHSRRDDGDYEELINKANSLNVKKLAYFHGSDGWPNKTSTFCRESWERGWVRKYERKYLAEYRCYLANEMLCDEQNGWEYYGTTSTDEFREVIY